jgi:hypothetical protein
MAAGVYLTPASSMIPLLLLMLLAIGAGELILGVPSTRSPETSIPALAAEGLETTTEAKSVAAGRTHRSIDRLLLMLPSLPSALVFSRHIERSAVLEENQEFWRWALRKENPFAGVDSKRRQPTATKAIVLIEFMEFCFVISTILQYPLPVILLRCCGSEDFNLILFLYYEKYGIRIVLGYTRVYHRFALKVKEFLISNKKREEF